MALNIDIGNEGSSSHCKEYVADESSESEDETEPAKVFNRRLSTNKDLKNTKCIKDGYLYKQASFQRWRKRFFKLKGCKLYYAKHTKSSIFDEIELIGASLAECSIKNINHSFQVITPFRNLVLCADHRREMEEWISALRAAANKEYYDPNSDHKEMLSGQHHWYACSHARPTYCNVCREALSGVTSHGLSCEVCKFKVHKRCAASAAHTCKWTTLSSVGDAIIEDDDRNLYMPHQWVEGNLAVSAKCSHCDKTCGSVLRLQDWRCLWCKSMVHSTCKDQLSAWCTLGQHRISILPPIAVNNLDSDGLWEASKPVGVSPLLVFINSRSGNNQGIKMYRRFKQLLNPAQVFDLNNGGPGIGLRLFKNFDSFRIVVCGGDGTIGWVLTEIDVMELHKQCQVGVLPLGTGNDLARVLGWGGAFDDDAQLPSALDRLEHAQVKILDRWSILTYEGMMPDPRKASYQFDPMSTYEHNVADHLSKIIHSDDHNAVISSAKVLCETVKSFVDKVAPGEDDENEETIDGKCKNLNEKLDALMSSLDSESKVEPVKKPETKTRVALMSRANSLKKCVRQIIEQTEKVVDEQNAQTKVLHKQCKAMSESNIESAGKSVDMQIMTAGSPSNEALPSLVEREEDSDGLRLPRKASPDNRERLKTNGPNNEDLVEQAANIDDALLTAASHKGVGLFPSWHKSGPSRRLSSMSTMHKVISFVPTSDKDKKSYKEATAGLSIFNKPPFPRLPKRVRKDLQNNIIQMTGSTKDVSSGMASKLTGGGLISKVLLANADALCAAVSPLVQEELDLGEYGERYVMNNYFGIGLDAKVTLDFHNKRETHPEQFKSRNKNKIWFGVISSREFLNKTYKNLEQKVQLECDGQKIPLPNLQGLVILNIASYMAGIPFWGTAKGDETFKTPSMDDHILEVVAVFGIAHMGVSRFLSLQRHRIAQCQSVKITILGDEGVPIQVDGEAWLQPPGYIQIIHKNRAQMLTRDKVFEEAMKTWMEKVHLDPPSTEEHPPHELSEAEISLLQSFVEATESLIKNVKMASICHTLIDQELSHLANQSSCFLDRLYPEGQLTKPTPRSQVSDLVSSVRTLYNETNAFFSEKISALHINADVEEKVMVALGLLEVELRKVYEIGGLPHFHTMVEETQAVVEKQKEKARFRPFGRFKKVNKKEKDVRVSMSTNVQIIESWSKEDVCQWLKTLELLDYCDSFFTNEITGKELLTLGRQDLKDIGVSKVGHVKRILQEIKALRQKSPLPDYRNS